MRFLHIGFWPRDKILLHDELMRIHLRFSDPLCLPNPFDLGHRKPLYQLSHHILSYDLYFNRGQHNSTTVYHFPLVM